MCSFSRGAVQAVGNRAERIQEHHGAHRTGDSETARRLPQEVTIIYKLMTAEQPNALE